MFWLLLVFLWCLCMYIWIKNKDALGEYFSDLCFDFERRVWVDEAIGL